MDLFTRVGRNLELTENGRLVLSYADEIFSLGGELEEVIHQQPEDRPQLFIVTGMKKPSGLTVKTEQSICLRTSSAVLPIKNPGSPTRPTVPITMSSMCSSHMDNSVLAAPSYDKGPTPRRTSSIRE